MPTTPRARASLIFTALLFSAFSRELALLAFAPFPRRIEVSVADKSRPPAREAQPGETLVPPTN